MNEQELMKIWQKSYDLEKIEVNLPLLIAELRSEIEKIDSIIINRDRSETLASVFGILLYLFFLWYIPFFWVKTASVMMIMWFLFVIYYLKKTRSSHSVDFSLSLVEQLRSRRQYLLRQQKLLENAAYWYILPPFLINVLFFFGVDSSQTWDSPIAFIFPDNILGKTIVVVFLAILYTYLIWANRNAAQSTYPPLIESIDKVKAELENEGLTSN